MRALLAAVLCAALAAPTAAQRIPQLDPANPRLQTIDWQEGETTLLTALPQTGLTVILEPAERIARVVLSDDRSFDIRVSPEQNSFLVLPQESALPATLVVETDRRSYDFALRTGSGLTAAYLVRFDYTPAAPPQAVAPEEQTGERWTYRLRGDRSVRPADIYDDGRQTFITYGPEQALAAVFAIGPSDDEEVVNGYMRDGIFVIDRVHEELVFRIDKEKATARRQSQAEERR